jgi:hypothetical protein
MATTTKKKKTLHKRACPKLYNKTVSRHGPHLCRGFNNVELEPAFNFVVPSDGRED